MKNHIKNCIENRNNIEPFIVKKFIFTDLALNNIKEILINMISKGNLSINIIQNKYFIELLEYFYNLIEQVISLILIIVI